LTHKLFPTVKIDDFLLADYSVPLTFAAWKPPPLKRPCLSTKPGWIATKQYKSATQQKVNKGKKLGT